jgi:ADP-heptose:LPS heptosyltransferase
MSVEPFKKILIIRPRFLGDLILSTGLTDVIHQANPGAEIWYLVENTYAETLHHHPRITGLLELDSKQKNNPFHLLKLNGELHSKKFDVVLDLFSNPRTARWTYFSGASKRVGFEGKGRSWAYNVIAKPSSEPLSSGRRPVTEAYLDQLRAIGLFNSQPYRTSLAVHEDEKNHARKLLERAQLKPGERTAVLTPGATWPAKRWPLERFVELGFILQSRGVRPLFIFGPKEDELVKEFEGKMNKDWILINQPSIRGLMAFIEAADVLISNDAGPMHVGPAVNTPTLGIFGPGEPEIWFPYPKPHEAVYAEIPCSHCGLDDCPMLACMDHLDSEQVARRALALAKG